MTEKKTDNPGAYPSDYEDDGFEEPLGDGGQTEGFPFSNEEEEAEYDTSFYKPMQSRKAWAILALILVIIAVSVLYVYQTGDKKTILGNQPIPAGQSNMFASPAAVTFLGPAPALPMSGAVNVPMGGAVLNPSPVGGAAPAGIPAAARNNLVAQGNPVQCPRCATQGMPFCSGCGAVMQPLNSAAGTYVCPVCGTVGVPICPRCGGHMSTPGGTTQSIQATPPVANMGGQFQCPACRATGLPNWSPNGVPLCPNCGTTMNVRSPAAPMNGVIR